MWEYVGPCLRDWCKTLRMSKIQWVAIVGILATACSGNRSQSQDGGTGGGAGGGGGGSSASGGNGGSSGTGGGGTSATDECDFTGARPCPSGSQCTFNELPNGRVGLKCTPGACDLVTQDCPTNQRCSWVDGGRACIADGTVDEGQPCSENTDSCKRGAACILTKGDAGFTCSRFCRDTQSCASPQQCYVTLVSPDTLERPKVCADPPTSCNILIQNCPGTTDSCYPGSQGALCLQTGTGALGTACQYSNDCASGLACAGTASNAACRKVCAFPSGMPSCDNGQNCTRLQQFTDVGVCL